MEARQIQAKRAKPGSHLFCIYFTNALSGQASHQRSVAAIAQPVERKRSMLNLFDGWRTVASRRSFFKRGVAAGTATVGGALLTGGLGAFAAQRDKEEKSGRLTKGDAS